MNRERQTSDHAPEAENSKGDRASRLKKVIQGLGLTLIGAAAALPVVCLYLTRRMLRKKEERPLTRKSTPAKGPASSSHPIRIPIHVQEAKPPEATASSEQRATGEETTPSPGRAPRYLASTESDKFHNPTCRWARQIRQEHRIELFNRQEALARGLIPCKTCDP